MTFKTSLVISPCSYPYPDARYVTELSERIKVKSPSHASSSEEEEEEGGDAQFVQFFPNFVWAVRDFTLDLNIDGKEVTADGYLEHSLELKKGIHYGLR